MSNREIRRNQVGVFTDEQLFYLDCCINDGDFGEFDEIGRSDFFHCAKELFDETATEADYLRWLNEIGV